MDAMIEQRDSSRDPVLEEIERRREELTQRASQLATELSSGKVPATFLQLVNDLMSIAVELRTCERLEQAVADCSSRRRGAN